MPLTETIDLLELIWSLVTVLGVIQTGLNISDCVADLRWVREYYASTTLEVRVAWDNLRTESMRCLASLCLLTVGVISMLLPPRAEDLTTDWQIQVAGASRWISPLALLLTVIILLVDSSITRRVNRRLLSAVHTHHDAEQGELALLQAQADVAGLEGAATQINERGAAH